MRPLLLALLGLAPAFAAPRIYWASQPVRPDETLLVVGDGLGERPALELAAGERGAFRTVASLQGGPRSIKAVVPADLPVGIYRIRVRVGDQVSNELTVNAPEPWWLQADQGQAGTPGGWLRLFGNTLQLDQTPGLALVSASGAAVPLSVREAGPYSLAADLPATLAPGVYEVRLTGGGAACRAGQLSIVPPVVWPSTVYRLSDFGPRPAEALAAALKKAEANGGGIIYLPRGRYVVPDGLVIPPHTILRGEKMELVNLCWPDLATPPAALVSGRAFGLEELTLYCQSHKNVVQAVSGPAPDGVRIRRVRVRANAYFMIEDARKPFRQRSGPASPWDCGAAFRIEGSNYQVTDCDFYATNRALQVHPGATDGVIARNRLRYGGRGYGFEHVQRLVFEDNDLAGNNLTAIGNDVSTFWSNNVELIWYARNHLHDMYGADREMMTLDAGGGAYFGGVAAVEGTALTLADDPKPMDYAPKPHTDWTGAAVLILDGTGAGQYRRVVRNDGRRWEVDRPWLVPPDATSKLSVVPFRGRMLFIGNTFEDGGAVQLYGMPVETILADNQGARMDGFFAWGLNPHGWGWQPAWYCQFLGNHVTEGNGYGPRAAQIAAFTSDTNEQFPGPLARGMVFRGNRLDNNARLRVGGTVEDAVIEHNTVAHNEVGVDVGKQTRGVLLRANRFDDVTTPITGDGAPAAVVIP